MTFIVSLLIGLLGLYLWVIILSVIVSWLVVFGVLNVRNKWIYKFCVLLDAITNPLVLRLRKVIPPVGGIDLTPMVIIFGIWILQGLLASLISS